MNEKYLSGISLLIVNIALSLATFMIVLDYSIANVSIPYIAGDLGVSSDQGTYVITSFAVGNAIILPMSGWLTRRIGAVKLLCISLLLFTFFSWICGASLSFPMLVVCRFLQGLVSGPLIPLSQTLTISCNPPERRTMALAFWGMVVITAPILGPILGGWISYDYTWPWIFYINLPVGIISAAVIWHFLKQYVEKPSKGAVDWVGFIFLAIGVGTLQIFLDKGQQYDWLRSEIMTALIITSIIAFTLLIIWELYHPTPLIELKLFKIKSFSASIIFIAVAYAIYFGAVVLVPLWLQTNMGYTSIWAGLAVCPIGIAPFILAAFMGKIFEKYGILIPLGICFVLFSIASFYTAFLDTDADIWTIGFSRFLVGCALVFFITPLISLSVQDLPTDKLSSGAGIFHFVRAMVGGVGTSVFTTMWIRRSVYHHERVGSALTPASQNTDEMLGALGDLGLTDDRGLEVLNNLLNDQAAMLAINDCSYLMGWIFLALLIFLPMGRKKKTSRAATLAPSE